MRITAHRRIRKSCLSFFLCSCSISIPSLRGGEPTALVRNGAPGPVPGPSLLQGAFILPCPTINVNKFAESSCYNAALRGGVFALFPPLKCTPSIEFHFKTFLSKIVLRQPLCHKSTYPNEIDVNILKYFLFLQNLKSNCKLFKNSLPPGYQPSEPYTHCNYPVHNQIS